MNKFRFIKISMNIMNINDCSSKYLKKITKELTFS